MSFLGKFFGGIKGIVVFLVKKRFWFALALVLIGILSSIIESIVQRDFFIFIGAFGQAVASFNSAAIAKMDNVIATDYALSLGYFWALGEIILSFAGLYLIYKIVKWKFKSTTSNDIPWVNLTLWTIFLVTLLHIIFVLAFNPPLMLDSPEDCNLYFTNNCQTFKFVPFSSLFYFANHADDIFEPFDLGNRTEIIQEVFPDYNNSLNPNLTGESSIEFVNQSEA